MTILFLLPKSPSSTRSSHAKYFGGKNPVGHTFHLEAEAGKTEPLFQIVGLVKNTKYYDSAKISVPSASFPPHRAKIPDRASTLSSASQVPPGAVINNTKAAIAEISPTIAFEFKSFSQQLEDSLLRERLMATLSGAFGILAVALATVGLYGVISYLVTRRRSEIGIRIALGADCGRVIFLVLREAMLLLGIGVVVGVLISVWVGRTAATLLYGLKPYDPVSLIGACLLLAGIALAASYVPARREPRWSRWWLFATNSSTPPVAHHQITCCFRPFRDSIRSPLPSAAGEPRTGSSKSIQSQSSKGTPRPPTSKAACRFRSPRPMLHADRA